MKIFVVFGEHFSLTFVHQNVHCLHDERGRRTRRGNGPLKAGTGRRKPQQVRVQDSWKPLGAERHTKHRKRGEVKTIRAKKPPIEALYPELPARRPNKG